MNDKIAGKLAYSLYVLLLLVVFLYFLGPILVLVNPNPSITDIKNKRESTQKKHTN